MFFTFFLLFLLSIFVSIFTVMTIVGIFYFLFGTHFTPIANIKLTVDGKVYEIQRVKSIYVYSNKIIVVCMMHDGNFVKSAVFHNYKTYSWIT